MNFWKFDTQHPRSPLSMFVRVKFDDDETTPSRAKKEGLSLLEGLDLLIF